MIEKIVSGGQTGVTEAHWMPRLRRKFRRNGGAELLGDFIEKNAIRVLNVAGPRESGWPGAAAYSSELIRRFLTSD